MGHADCSSQAKPVAQPLSLSGELSSPHLSTTISIRSLPASSHHHTAPSSSRTPMGSAQSKAAPSAEAASTTASFNEKHVSPASLMPTGSKSGKPASAEIVAGTVKSWENDFSKGECERWGQGDGRGRAHERGDRVSSPSVLLVSKLLHPILAHKPSTPMETMQADSF